VIILKFILFLAITGAMKSAYQGDALAMVFLAATFVCFALLHRFRRG